MEYLQYLDELGEDKFESLVGFKPYYKWNTFNTSLKDFLRNSFFISRVLNLIINGIPSIQKVKHSDEIARIEKGFKPYYKWNTFNTESKYIYDKDNFKCFKPYYKWNTFNTL